MVSDIEEKKRTDSANQSVVIVFSTADWLLCSRDWFYSFFL